TEIEPNVYDSRAEALVFSISNPVEINTGSTTAAADDEGDAGRRHDDATQWPERTDDDQARDARAVGFQRPGTRRRCGARRMEHASRQREIEATVGDPVDARIRPALPLRLRGDGVCRD